jgi:hypothetical protein
VNYGGSTGYGRKYRKRLAGNWGVVGVLSFAAVFESVAGRKPAERCPAYVHDMLLGWWRHCYMLFCRR